MQQELHRHALRRQVRQQRIDQKGHVVVKRQQQAVPGEPPRRALAVKAFHLDLAAPRQALLQQLQRLLQDRLARLVIQPRQVVFRRLGEQTLGQHGGGVGFVCGSSGAR